MRYDAILFDMDETLIESAEGWVVATERALAECGISFTQEEQRSLAGKFLRDLLREKGHPQDFIERLCLLRDEYALDALREHARWIDGAESVLETLADQPTAIVTGAHWNGIDVLDGTLKIRDRVHTVVGWEDSLPHPKPHPHCIRVACERLGVAPEKTLFIGDQEFDLLAAKGAGADFILYRGRLTPPGLQHEKMIDRLSQILEII